MTTTPEQDAAAEAAAAAKLAADSKTVAADEAALEAAADKLATDTTTAETALATSQAQTAAADTELAASEKTVSADTATITADAAEIATLEGEVPTPTPVTPVTPTPTPVTPTPVVVSTAPAVPAPTGVAATASPKVPLAAPMYISGNGYGIFYLPPPTISFSGLTAASGTPTAATSWVAYDAHGVEVGSGTVTAADDTVTVVADGSWVGGTTAAAGYYTIVGFDGTTVITSGTAVICSASSRLYNPSSWAYNAIPRLLAPWLGTGPDRDMYQFPQCGDTVYATPAEAAAQIVANAKADPYFSATQDPARPHKLWISSSSQATSPTQAPTAAAWGEMAAALVAAGHAGAFYDAPTNEPENGGWSNSEIVTYWQECSTAILAADPTANVMGWCSGGIFNNSDLADVAAFLAACKPAAFSNHMENSHENLSNIVALRQYFGALKTQFATSGVPDLDLWLTETGINGGQYGVLQPRREARQRTVLRFVAESFGWAKEHSYDFPYADHVGSGLSTYLSEDGGSLRAGAYALHVMGEALWGTTCTPASPPAKLSFGPTGSVGDSLFAGLVYTGTDGDVVVLATNGIETATVTLDVSATGALTWWDGMGVEGTVTVADGQVTIPVDDLLTYLFVPSGTTVSVVDTDQGAVTFSSATNLALAATVVNEAGTATPSVHNGSFAANNGSGYGVPGATAPYEDSTIPATLTASGLDGTVTGFALMTSGPAWQTAGCSLSGFSVKVDGETVYTYTSPSAVSAPIPSSSGGNPSDPCNRTSWWTGPFAWVVKLPTPVAATSVELSVTATGYGGQPDEAASDDTSASYHEGDPMQLQLAEFQIF